MTVYIKSRAVAALLSLALGFLVTFVVAQVWRVLASTDDSQQDVGNLLLLH